MTSRIDHPFALAALGFAGTAAALMLSHGGGAPADLDRGHRPGVVDMAALHAGAGSKSVRETNRVLPGGVA